MNTVNNTAAKPSIGTRTKEFCTRWKDEIWGLIKGIAFWIWGWVPKAAFCLGMILLGMITMIAVLLYSAPLAQPMHLIESPRYDGKSYNEPLTLKVAQNIIENGEKVGDYGRYSIDGHKTWRPIFSDPLRPNLATGYTVTIAAKIHDTFWFNTLKGTIVVEENIELGQEDQKMEEVRTKIVKQFLAQVRGKSRNSPE